MKYTVSMSLWHFGMNIKARIAKLSYFSGQQLYSLG
jgi:hypothetical protein